MEREIDDAVLTILAALHAEATGDRTGRNEPGLSLAKLSKRVELRMSTLRRQLSALEDAEIVSVIVNDDGTGRVTLTPLGMAIFDALDESRTTATEST
ncbi:helix-turn-helix domain protein [Collimonas arenae]|uniref:Helix-turn-helix domain protein n=1 Tax=Collimonas arenae TaxID=279058 RepID=A0A127QEF3_9BURK|nr:helix-turn-helix domain-containing protein [Collimonas arenae]AMP08374.1 helix-turn-helix domain protein [Collimonas arenae]